MSIVKHYDKKSGTTRVYESTPHYDPISKQSRPKRKYLGILDDETGEIIPSSGRKGRRSSTPNETTNNTDTNPLSIKIKALKKTISDKNDEITSLKTEIKKLNSVISNYEKICQGIVNTLVSISGK